MIAALSRTPFWKSTVVFVLEDDAQNGPDHVDSHRSPLLVISPYSRPGAFHRFTNTTDVIRTIEGILNLGALSHFDHFGRPLTDVWSSEPDLRPFDVLTPAVRLDERNPAAIAGRVESLRLTSRQRRRIRRRRLQPEFCGASSKASTSPIPVRPGWDCSRRSAGAEYAPLGAHVARGLCPLCR